MEQTVRIKDENTRLDTNGENTRLKDRQGSDPLIVCNGMRWCYRIILEFRPTNGSSENESIVSALNTYFCKSVTTPSLLIQLLLEIIANITDHTSLIICLRNQLCDNSCTVTYAILEYIHN